MSLNDSFNEDSEKSRNKGKTALTIKTTKVVELLKTKVNDIRIEYLSRLSHKAKMGIGAGLLGIVVLSSAIFVSMGSDVYAVNISGQQIGYIEEEEMLSQTIEEITADLSIVSGGLEITVDNEALDSEAVEIDDKNVTLLSKEELKEKILDSGICKAKAWAIRINDTNVVAAASEEDANSILEGVKSSYQSEGSELVSATFKESVSVTQAAVSTSEIMKPEDAVSLIITGSKEPKTYTVQDGDTIWDIAASNGMTSEELQNANPGFNPDKLKIGQMLNLYEVKPYLTVQTKEVVATTEKIDYKTVYENTSTLYKGEIKVKTAGVYGTKEIKTEVVKENGVTIASNVIDSVVTAEPKAQVALKGTKAISTFTGSGTFSNPMSKMQISSAYGSRGGGRHTGVDLRNPKGTPIKAADAGVVSYVGYSGTYGNLIKLSHGNGLETWYAHCDTMKVSVGQTVSKGETIATVGITGRATGYHLHFEVRKNGVPQNPMNYL